MWVKAEQSNIRVTSAGCAMAGVMMAGRDRAAAITRFIFTPPLANWGQTHHRHNIAVEKATGTPLIAVRLLKSNCTISAGEGALVPVTHPPHEKTR
jgi:hypothetical protein